ncbi:hypothetical protein PHMEG_00031900 [Phytophthora megakarya]|uniref:Uncharacterized protein n=1 Tax=Phytophthora megakarya TaxID=4795 RepID=A0A225UXK7_9STRA|nr:hypothetical protein PHMEG_00031900 [Phytophthora megakarya]
MEHQDNVARLISEMPRCSPRRRTLEIQEAPCAAPAAKPLAKPLVFRKTKREIEREQQKAQLEQIQSKKRRVGEKMKMERARPKCARMLEWSCRGTSRVPTSAGVRESKRRLRF